MPVRKIKERVLRNRIKGEQKRSTRQKKLIPWSEIRSVGILYQVPEEDEYVKFTEHVARLQAEKKEIKTLGLMPGKEPPHYCYPKLYYSYFSRKEINWMGKARGQAVSDFVAQEFDLLINMDQTANQLFDCLASLSKARLKSGVYKQDFSMVYDLMISPDALLNNEDLLTEIRKWIESLCPAKNAG